jgi:hypothetical protein
MLILVATLGHFRRVRVMRWLFYLIPSLFFLTSYMILDGTRELPMAQLQAEAGVISARMNEVSDNISLMVQEVNLGRVEYLDIEGPLGKADLQLAELKRELSRVWEEVDRHEVGIARDEIIRKLFGVSGVVCGILGLALVSKRHREYSPHCILVAGILLAATVI